MTPAKNQRNLWQVAAKRYAIPNLSGEWQLLGSGRRLLLRPLGFIARGIAAQQFSVVAILTPLFMPLDYDQPDWVVATECNVPGHYPFSTLKLGEEHAEKYMSDLVEAINGTVYPHFSEIGTLEGFFARYHRMNSVYQNGIGDAHLLYQQAATAIVLSRFGDAVEALDKLQQAIESDPTDDREWVRNLYGQAGTIRGRVVADATAVRDELILGMDEQKRRRKLPLTG